MFQAKNRESGVNVIEDLVSRCVSYMTPQTKPALPPVKVRQSLAWKYNVIVRNNSVNISICS